MARLNKIRSGLRELMIQLHKEFVSITPAQV
jgi:hypothetical protein